MARWRKNLWDRLAYVARYGHVTPNESARWDLFDLNDFAKSLNEIVVSENKVSKTPRKH